MIASINSLNITDLAKLDQDSVIPRRDLDDLIRKVADTAEYCFLMMGVAKHHHYFGQMSVKNLIELVKELPQRTDERACLQRRVEALPVHWRDVFYRRVYHVAQQERSLPSEPAGNWGETNAFVDLRRTKIALRLVEVDRANFRSEMKEKLYSKRVPDSPLFRAVLEMFALFIDRYRDAWISMDEFQQEVFLKEWREKLYFIMYGPSGEEQDIDCLCRVIKELISGSYSDKDAFRLATIALDMARRHPKAEEIQDEIWFRILQRIIENREYRNEFWPFAQHEGSKLMYVLQVNESESRQLKDLTGAALDVHSGTCLGNVGRIKLMAHGGTGSEEMASRYAETTSLGRVPYTRKLLLGKGKKRLLRELEEIKHLFTEEKAFNRDGKAARRFSALPDNVKSAIYHHFDQIANLGHTNRVDFWSTRGTQFQCEAIDAFCLSAHLGLGPQKGSLQKWLPDIHPVCDGYDKTRVDEWMRQFDGLSLEVQLHAVAAIINGEEDGTIKNSFRRGDHLYLCDNDRCLMVPDEIAQPKMWTIGTPFAFNPLPRALLLMLVHKKWWERIDAVNQRQGIRGAGIDPSRFEAQQRTIGYIRSSAGRALEDSRYSCTPRELFFRVYEIDGAYKRVEGDEREVEIFTGGRLRR